MISSFHAGIYLGFLFGMIVTSLVVMAHAAGPPRTTTVQLRTAEGLISSFHVAVDDYGIYSFICKVE